MNPIQINHQSVPCEFALTGAQLLQADLTPYTGGLLTGPCIRMVDHAGQLLPDQFGSVVVAMRTAIHRWRVACDALDEADPTHQQYLAQAGLKARAAQLRMEAAQLDAQAAAILYSAGCEDYATCGIGSALLDFRQAQDALARAQSNVAHHRTELQAVAA